MERGVAGRGRSLQNDAWSENAGCNCGEWAVQCCWNVRRARGMAGGEPRRARSNSGWEAPCRLRSGVLMVASTGDFEDK